MNFYLITLINLMLGTLITISSSSWLTAWLGMELNLLNFLPFMINKNNSLSSENTMKYFLIQSISSSLFILISTISLFSLMKSFNLLMFMILAMKLAIAPLHFWLPPSVESLNWMTLILLLTWQKIAPLSVITNLQSTSIPMIILSLLLGSSMMINQTSLKKLFTYSSISHLGWLLTPMLSNINYSLIYFLLYSFTSFSLMILFNYYNTTNLSHMLTLPNNLTFILLINMLSISGFPPLIMFFPKFLIIMHMISLNSILPYFLIISSLISMFSYLRLIWPMILSPINFSKMKSIPSIFPPFMILNFILIPLIFPIPLLISL